MIIISIISIFYTEFCENKYISIALKVMRAGVSYCIIDVTIDLAKNLLKTKNIIYIAMMIIAFISRCFWKCLKTLGKSHKPI